jgi:hypothetical protein
MAKERVRVKAKPIKPIQPKKRVKPTIDETKKPIKEVKSKKVIDVISVETVDVEKRNENKYSKISAENYKDSYETINVKVKNGELKWAHYATEGDKGYHYFIHIKK